MYAHYLYLCPCAKNMVSCDKIAKVFHNWRVSLMYTLEILGRGINLRDGKLPTLQINPYLHNYVLKIYIM